MYYIVSRIENDEPAVRVLDAEDSTVVDMTVSDLVQALKNESMVIENAVVENDNLRMINGKLSSYGKIALGEEEDEILDKALVILEELVDTKSNIVGYTIANPVGEISQYAIGDMMGISKEYSFANADFQNKGGLLYMIAKEQPYPRVTVDVDGVATEVEEDESNFVYMLVYRDGKEQKTKVNVEQLDKGLMAIGYKNINMEVYQEETEDGVISKYRITRGVPDELVTDSNNTLVTIELPESVEIGQNVFANSERLREVISYSTEIGKGAFMMCPALERVILNNTVLIDDLAFFNDKELFDINLPDTLEKIGFSAFDGCKLSEIDLPDDLKVLNSLAFSNNSELRRVSIPRSIKEVWLNDFKSFKQALVEQNMNLAVSQNMGTFMGCSNLVKTNLSAKDIIGLSDYQFKGCSLLIEHAHQKAVNGKKKVAKG